MATKRATGGSAAGARSGTTKAKGKAAEAYKPDPKTLAGIRKVITRLAKDHPSFGDAYKAKLPNEKGALARELCREFDAGFGSA
jgi:hypothetical protein